MQSPPRANIELLRGMLGDLAEAGVDEETQVMDRIVGSILVAESTDEVLTPTDPVPAVDVLGEMLTVHGISFSPSKVESSILGYYANLHGSLASTDRTVVVNCGSTQVVAQAAWLYHNAEFPLVVCLYEVAPAKDGRSAPLALKWAKADMP